MDQQLSYGTSLEDSSLERRDSNSSQVEVGEYPAHVLLVNDGRQQDGLDFSDIYQDGSTALKYMPVDMLNAPKVKTSIARGLLLDLLVNGVPILKHPRQGKPKRKVLTCDPQVSSLVWYPDREGNMVVDDPSEGKGVKLTEISDIHFGIEPEHDVQALSVATSDVRANGSRKNFFKKTVNALFSKGTEPGTPTEGTPGPVSVLHRNCTPEELSLSFSLVLQDRTLDIQCLSKKDYDILSINLKELIKPQLTPIQKTASFHTKSFHGAMDTYQENPLKKLLRGPKGAVQQNAATEDAARKSVRFNGSSGGLVNHVHQQSQRSLHSDSGSFYGKNPEDVHTFDMTLDLEPDAKPSSHMTQINSHESPINHHDAQFVDSLRMSSTEALQIGLILADQERKYGLNMYQSVGPSDRPRIDAYVSRGFTVEEAILRLFEKKHVPPHLHTNLGPMTRDDIDSDEELENEAKDISLSPKASPSLTAKKSSFLRNIFNEIDRDPTKCEEFVTAIKQEHRLIEGKMAGRRLKSTDALQTGLLLSQQEAAYGTNMYESLVPADAVEIRSLMGSGFSLDDAVMDIFRRRFVSTNSSPVVDTRKTATIDVDSVKPQAEEHVDFHSPSQRTGSAFFPNSASVLPSSNTKAGGVPPPRSIPRMNSSEAVQMAMMLSEQEEKHGVNMFDSLRPADEPEIERLVALGYTLEQAVYALFEQKFMTDSNAGGTAEASGSSNDEDDTSSIGDGEVEVEIPGDDDATFGMVYPPQGQQPQPQQPFYPPQSYPPQYPTYPPPPPGYAPPPTYPSGYGYGPGPGYPQPPTMYPGGYYPPPNGNPYGYPMQQGYYQDPQQAYYAQMAYHHGAMQSPHQQPHQQQPPPQRMQPPPMQHYSTGMGSNSSVASTGSGGSGSSRPSRSGYASDEPAKISKRPSIFGFGGSNRKVKESDVKTITSMGFTRDQAVHALMQFDNNVVLAIDSLAR